MSVKQTSVKQRKPQLPHALARGLRNTTFMILGGCLFINSALAVPVVSAPFDLDYSIIDLGPVPGVPTRYGGLTLKFDDLNTLLIGGAANTANGKLYAIRVTRDANGHIITFDVSLQNLQTPHKTTAELLTGRTMYCFFHATQILISDKRCLAVWSPIKSLI